MLVCWLVVGKPDAVMKLSFYCACVMMLMK